jgi:hypothetical protein
MWRDLDLDALGEPVSWAGPDPAPLWLDCARDFTEYWVHQQQIRDATGRPDTGGPPMVQSSTLRPHFMAALTGGLPTRARPAGPRRSIGRPRARTPSSTGHRTRSPAGRLRAGVPTRVSAPRNASCRSRRAANRQPPADEGHPKGARSPGTLQDLLAQATILSASSVTPGRAQAVDHPGAVRLVDDPRRVVAVVVGVLALVLNPATLRVRVRRGRHVGYLDHD